MSTKDPERTDLEQAGADAAAGPDRVADAPPAATDGSRGDGDGAAAPPTPDPAPLLDERAADPAPAGDAESPETGPDRDEPREGESPENEQHDDETRAANARTDAATESEEPGSDPRPDQTITAEAPRVDAPGGDAAGPDEAHAAAGSAPAPVPVPVPDVIPGSKWGWVDEDGNVRQRDGVRHRGRPIGKLAGRSRYSVFQFFVERFAKLDHHAEVLERDLRASPNKGRYSERVSRLLDRIRKADALGDFDALIDRVERMLAEIEVYQAEQAAKKEALCLRAAELSGSTDWKATTEAMKTLQQEWKTLGSTTRARDEELWTRFRGSMDEFFKRRDEDRQQKRADRTEGLRIKRELCERAEALRESTDWKKTADEQVALMETWKKAPWAGKSEEDKLWARFRAARSAFFERRSADRKSRQGALTDNRKRKDELCEAAEGLLASEDHYAACEQVKQLQAEWKNVGPAPRSVSEKQWARFRTACNTVFERARAARAQERGRPRGTGRRPPRGGGSPRTAPRPRDRTEELRESIARDQEALDRWRQTLDRMKGGGAMRDSLEAKVSEIATRLDGERARLASLEQAARARREAESAPAKPAPPKTPAPDAGA